jgi:hypothetical protein
MLGIILALTSLVIGGSMATARPLQQSPASAMRVSAFYPITKAAYTVWAPKTKAPAPAVTRVFPKGTTDVGYYFHYHGVVAHATIYQVVIYDQTGAPYLTGNNHKAVYSSGEVANYFGGGKPYDNGSYRMDLLLNGVVAASTTFSVGTAAVSTTPISTGGAIGQRVNTFYPISLAAYKAWTAHTPAPAPSRVFPRGTTTIGYYIAYQDMAAKSTFQVVIDDQAGAASATGSKHAFPYVKGEQLSYFSGTTFKNGTYHMDLIVNGIVVDSVAFTVGS